MDQDFRGPIQFHSFHSNFANVLRTGAWIAASTTELVVFSQNGMVRTPGSIDQFCANGKGSHNR